MRSLVKAGWFAVGIERDGVLRDRLLTSIDDHVDVVLGDVRDRSILEEAAKRARAKALLAGWVNNAGIESRAALHELEPTTLEKALAVDLMAFVWGCQVAIRAFMAQRSTGRILNVSSLHGRAGYSDWAAYDIAKGAVEALTRYIAVEYGPVGIRANAVAPGSVRTQMHERYVASTPDPSATERAMAAVVPLRRIAEPNEVASVATFLLSDAASYVTGQSVAVDGGVSVAGGVFPPHPDLVAIFGLTKEP